MSNKKWKILQIFSIIISGIITFGLAWFYLSNNNLTGGLLILALSIILFFSAGISKLSFKIDELKDEIKKDKNVK